MITLGQMEEYEKASEILGIDRFQLMQNAGSAAAKQIKSRNIVVVCHHGNNGGDGFVIARKLKAKVFFTGHPHKLKPEALSNYKKLKKRQFTESIDGFDTVVDCILGTGIAGEIKEPIASIIKQINRSDATKVCIDVPSGTDPDSPILPRLHVKPDRIITFHDKKPVHKNYSQITKVLDIGIPEITKKLVTTSILDRLPGRKAGSHKGENGRILIIGGSQDYVGAPALCGRAALRAGADLVTIACPEKAAYAINSYMPELITLKLEGKYLKKEHVKKIDTGPFDVILIGPGLGLHSKDAVKEILKSDKPKIVDADAIECVSLMDNVLLTPHKKEFETWSGLKLADDPNKNIRTVMKMAGKGVILLKGQTDIIGCQKENSINMSGNSSMTSGGTGDVLAGVCAGLFSQTRDLCLSAKLGAYITGKAGEILYKRKGFGYLASELADNISQIIKKR